MPISKKILSKIESAQAEQDEKKLMLEILNIEDKGTNRYNAGYEKAINDYIAAHGEEDN